MKKNVIICILSLIMLLFVGHQMQKLVPSIEVVKFEFIFSEKNVSDLVTSSKWVQTDEKGKNFSDRLKTNTYWDFGYIVAYSLYLVFLAKLILANHLPEIKNLSNLVYNAAFFDVIENILLIKLLNGNRYTLPTFMTICASLKFILLALYLLLLIYFGMKYRTVSFRKV